MNFKIQNLIMSLRKDLKNKEKISSQYTLNITIQSPLKQYKIKSPNPCPASTLKELIQKQLASLNSKIAYFQTTDSDWLTDYKMQYGAGWIRKDITLRIVLNKNVSQNSTDIDDYKILKCIGVGGFSKVFLARDRRDGVFYAAKFIEKTKLKNKEELIQNQRQINQSLNFPFLVHMKAFIQTELYFVMVLDYCPGGQLFHLQRKVIRFEEEEAKKYFIEVLLAIENLHSKEIVYRDLKPENIMLDVGGHVKIADFGLAKIAKQKRYSFCGSLQYMSPQILSRAGHSFQVDYYCMGALLYQMAIGCPPFYEPESSDNDTKHRILTQQVQFPDDLVLSGEIKNLISSLLQKDPKQRLGHLGGIKEIKCHPWIGWINRSDYLTKKIQMPYPVNLDCFNFDSNDITVSANRILSSIRSTYKIRNKKSGNSFMNKKSVKLLSPYREKSPFFQKNIKKMVKNTSVQKLKLRNSHFHCNSKKRKVSNQKNKDKLGYLKDCYLTKSYMNISNVFRFPTESSDHKTKQKQRKTYLKMETQCKQNEMQRKIIRKRRPKQEFIFMQIKRN